MITISNNEHWILDQAEIAGGNNFIISDEREYTYSEIADLSKIAASYLSEIGIRRDDRIPILAQNSFEFVLLINALWMLSAIPVPINPNLAENELIEVINHLDANFIIQLDKNISIDLAQIDVINFSINVIHNFDPLDEIAKFKSDSICLMIYTSGSTGSPKCVQLSFNNLFASIKAMDSQVNHHFRDVWLASLPFNHIGGLSIIFRTLGTGCSLVIPNSLSHENLEEEIKKHQPSFLSVVPTMHKRILDSFIFPWNRLKRIFIGGGPIADDLILSSLKNNWPISVVYGSTETASMVIMASTENLSANGISAGQPLPGVKIIIEQDSADKIQKEKTGRIVIESNSVSRSYYNYKEKNSELIQGKYYSNDLGRLDENGNLQILGRIDDIIISGGENISLIEIENLLSQKSDFRLSICLGIRDEKWGQSYIIVTDSKYDKIEEEILRYLSSNLSKYKLPKQIFKVNDIPVSPLGKPLKSEIKKIIEADFL